MRFSDRSHAGSVLAGLLDHLADQPTVVLGLPRGGVPVGYEIARRLAAPLEVLLVRKLGVPTQPELAMGAIGEGVFSLLVLVMFGYILLTPMGISFALKRLERAEAVAPPANAPPSLNRFALEGIRVREVLDRSRNYPQQSLTVKTFAEHWLLPEQHDYVVMNNGELAGVVSLAMLRYLPKHSWFDTKLEKIARRTTPNTWPDEHVEDALQRMTENSLTIMPVLERESGEFTGAITSQEILELITAEARGGQ